MRFNEITESTTSGSIATVAAPMSTQKRNSVGKGVYGNEKAGNLLTGKKTNKKYANSVNESKMKELAMDIRDMDNGNFQKKYNKSKEQMKAISGGETAKKAVREAHLEEDDLIIIPGQGHRLKSGFIPHGQSRLDHEVEMARSDLYSAAKNAKTIHGLIKDLSEEQGLEGWVQEKIIKANDYLNSVREYLEGKQIHEMRGGGAWQHPDGESMLDYLDGDMYGGFKKRQTPTHRSLVDLGNGRTIIPAGSEFRQSQGLGSNKRFFGVHLINGMPQERGLYRIDPKMLEPIDNQPEELDENLRDWFKEKWVRFGPDGKIRGACARGDDSEGKPKCLPQKKAQNLGKEGRKYAASKKRREDPNPERSGPAKNVATKKKSNEDIQVDEVWSQKYKDSINCSNPKGFSQKAHCAGKKKTNESIPFNQCPDCRGPIVHESMMNEKKDACYHKVKARYKVWPSAYASGALVKCRKKGASNWGKSKTNESSHDWEQIDADNLKLRNAARIRHMIEYSADKFFNGDRDMAADFANSQYGKLHNDYMEDFMDQYEMYDMGVPVDELKRETDNNIDVIAKAYLDGRASRQPATHAPFANLKSTVKGVGESTADGINKMFNNAFDPVTANLQRVALLAMQGRQSEVQSQLNRVLTGLDPAVQKKIVDAVNNIKPVSVNGKVVDSATLDKSKQHQEWIHNTFIPWVKKAMGQQGVAEGSGFDQEAGIGIDEKSFKFKIRDLVALADNYPVTKIDPQQFSKQIAGRDEDSTQSMARAEKADLQYPIIVVKRQNGQLWIADGTHRVHKAIMHKLPSINAKIIPIKDLAPFDVDQGVAEGAKVDRMVKHIAKSERSLGKSKDDAEDIAWATANKRGYLDNKNKKGK